VPGLHRTPGGCLMGTWIQDDGTEVVTDPETGEVIEDT
jgi:hypothetical protein